MQRKYIITVIVAIIIAVLILIYKFFYTPKVPNNSDFSQNKEIHLSSLYELYREKYAFSKDKDKNLNNIEMTLIRGIQPDVLKEIYDFLKIIDVMKLSNRDSVFIPDFSVNNLRIYKVLILKANQANYDVNGLSGEDDYYKFIAKIIPFDSINKHKYYESEQYTKDNQIKKTISDIYYYKLESDKQVINLGISTGADIDLDNRITNFSYVSNVDEINVLDTYQVECKKLNFDPARDLRNVYHIEEIGELEYATIVYKIKPSDTLIIKDFDIDYMYLKYPYENSNQVSEGYLVPIGRVDAEISNGKEFIPITFWTWILDGCKID